MSEIKGVLLVPAEDDQHKLLVEGPCGARPPTTTIRGEPVLQCLKCNAEFAGEEGESYSHGVMCPKCTGPIRGVCWPTGGYVGGIRTLVLAWDGKPVWKGIDAVDRVVRRSTATGFVLGVLRGKRSDQPGLPGTIVLIDAEGHEVTNV